MRAISGSAGLVVFVLLFAGSAHASVQISSAATKNMNCNAGVCSPTAKDAVLNVNDLTNMLSSADVTVKSGKRAVTIGILSPLVWASTHRLTLDAELNLNIKAPVTVEGTAGLAIITNDGGTGGDLMIYPGGKIDFWDTSSSLSINGKNYTLVADIKTLAADVLSNPSGNYALANGYDAGLDGKFRESVVQTAFHGSFEGLGHAIQHLTIHGAHRCVGLFAKIAAHGSVRGLLLESAEIVSAPRGIHGIGTLARCNYGSIAQVESDGKVVSSSATPWTPAGGLVGANSGVISRSSASVRVVGGSITNDIGGLVGRNRGEIMLSHAAGPVSGGTATDAGGLVGYEDGSISYSYATGDVSATEAVAGGLIGQGSGSTENCYATGNLDGGDGVTGGFVAWGGGTIAASYSIGHVKGNSNLGGFIGYQTTYADDKNTDTYWDLDTSGISDPSQGAGNIPNDPGITGLTDAQLKSGLPAGFDPAIWAQDPSINNGYPYLIANPPQ